jgi:hypothetical protein
MVNGSSVSHDPLAQTFFDEVKLDPGMNSISIVARDLAGNSSRKDLEIVYVPQDISFLATKENIHPFATDYNGDNTIDLLLGTDDGKIALYINRGNNENPSFFDYSLLSSGSDKEIIDIGERAFPCMADLNGDGLHDLLVGSGEGYVYYGKNQGTSEHPLFSQIELLEDIMHRPIKVDSNCKPAVVDWDGNGKNDILLGNAHGSILFVTNQSDNNDLQLTPPTPLEIDGEPLMVDTSSQPFIADWDNDGGKDLLIGDDTGHIYIYLNSVVNGKPDLAWGDKIKIAEHVLVLEKELGIPYFVGMSWVGFIL